MCVRVCLCVWLACAPAWNAWANVSLVELPLWNTRAKVPKLIKGKGERSNREWQTRYGKRLKFRYPGVKKRSQIIIFLSLDDRVTIHLLKFLSHQMDSEKRVLKNFSDQSRNKLPGLIECTHKELNTR